MFKLNLDGFQADELRPYDGKGKGREIGWLVKDGQTSYKIVVSEHASECERHAAEEMQAYLKKISTAEAEIVTDDVVALGEKAISIGKTALSDAADFSTENLNLDGFRIKTAGNTLLIKGQRDRGTLYGVYDYLEKFLCVRFLTEKFEYVPTATDIRFYELDITEIPTFMVRNHQASSIQRNLDFAAKKRMNSLNSYRSEQTAKYGGSYKDDWTCSMHGFDYFLPYDKYAKAHPEWFSGTDKWNSQPVMSNGLNDDGTLNAEMGESVLKEMIKNVEQELLDRPNVVFVALGQNDTHNFSEHPDCIRQRKLFGGYSGQLIVFINAIAREVKKWMREIGMEREVYFVTFAYQKTQFPPVKKVGDEYVPEHPLTVCRDDVAVMLAAYEASYNEPLKTEDVNDFNCVYCNQFKGWSAICKHLFMFDYSVNFSDALSWYPNTEVIYPNLVFYKEIKVKGVMTCDLAGNSCYQGMLNTYLFSRLQWTLEEDFEDLIKEFNRLYFGNEAGYMIDRLVRYIRKHFKRIADEDGYHKPAQIFSNASYWLISKETLNYNFLEECARLTWGARWHTSERSAYTEAEKKTFLEHIAAVDVMIKYMKYLNYDELYARCDEKKADFLKGFWEDVKKVGAKEYWVREGVTPIEALFTSHGIRAKW